MIPFPQDFKEFLVLLNQHEVEYLLIGGYAVAYHGYVRFTGDMDIFIRLSTNNLQRIQQVLVDFGFAASSVPIEIFQNLGSVVRMGVSPMRLEIINQISGVEFDECYQNKIIEVIDNVPVNIINLSDLKKNKAASGRPKDLNDLEYLP